MVVDPVLVTVEPPKTEKLAALPRGIKQPNADATEATVKTMTLIMRASLLAYAFIRF
jgi:hypothetical protein